MSQTSLPRNTMFATRLALLLTYKSSLEEIFLLIINRYTHHFSLQIYLLVEYLYKKEYFNNIHSQLGLLVCMPITLS